MRRSEWSDASTRDGAWSGARSQRIVARWAGSPLGESVCRRGCTARPRARAASPSARPAERGGRGRRR
eukprot:4737210-Prymnesium_polylepis.1